MTKRVSLFKVVSKAVFIGPFSRHLIEQGQLTNEQIAQFRTSRLEVPQSLRKSRGLVPDILLLLLSESRFVKEWF